MIRKLLNTFFLSGIHLLLISLEEDITLLLQIRESEKELYSFSKRPFHQTDWNGEIGKGFLKTSLHTALK